MESKDFSSFLIGQSEEKKKLLETHLRNKLTQYSSNFNDDRVLSEYVLVMLQNKNKKSSCE